MARPNQISVEEFIDLCEKNGHDWKWAKVLLYCELCKGGQANPYQGCKNCHGKGMRILEMPVMIVQKLPQEDFEFLQTAVRLGNRYG